MKSAAYVQDWKQQTVTRISFRIRPTRGWDEDTGRFKDERVRQADVYVFCLLAERGRAKVNPLDLAQWQFYVVSRATLDRAFTAGKTVSLGGIARHASPVGVRSLAEAVSAAALIS